MTRADSLLSALRNRPLRSWLPINPILFFYVHRIGALETFDSRSLLAQALDHEADVAEEFDRLLVGLRQNNIGSLPVQQFKNGHSSEALASLLWSNSQMIDLKYVVFVHFISDDPNEL